MIPFFLKNLRLLLLFLLQFTQIRKIICDEDVKSESTKMEELVEQDRGYIISGAFRENLPSSIFYETFIPLIYEFSTPQWNKTDIAFNNWYTCISETAPYRFSCPVAYVMNKAVVNLHIDFESLSPTEDFQSNNSEYFSILTSQSNFCDKIQKHFSSPFVQKEELKDYTEHLTNCRAGSTLEELETLNDINKTLAKHTYSVRDPFTKMENNFYHIFYRSILNSSKTFNNSLDRIASAVLSNSRISLQGSYLSFYYAERSRWSHAEMSCASQLIPRTLITREDFSEILGKIGNSSTFISNYDLSIDKNSISKYYHLPITDCTHTNDTFVVRILVPIVKKLRGKILSLVQLHTPSFFYKDHLCNLNLENGKIYIFNEFASSAFPTNCLPNELCSISDYSMLTHIRDPCVSAILSDENKDIRDHCNYKCTPLVRDSATEQSFTAHRIASNKYVLTKTSAFTSVFHVQCENMPSTDFNADKPTGAWLVTLPCKCHIILPGQQILYSELPCKQEYIALKSHWIVPIHFVNQSHFHFNENDENDAVTASDFEYKGEIETFQLSHLIDAEIVNSFISVGKTRVDTINSDKLNSEALVSNDSGSGNEVLWAVFSVVSFAIVIIQIYIIYELRRIKQISYPKDDRILYRVPDSPSSVHL